MTNYYKSPLMIFVKTCVFLKYISQPLKLLPWWLIRQCWNIISIIIPIFTIYVCVKIYCVYCNHRYFVHWIDIVLIISTVLKWRIHFIYFNLWFVFKVCWHILKPSAFPKIAEDWGFIFLLKWWGIVSNIIVVSKSW